MISLFAGETASEVWSLAATEIKDGGAARAQASRSGPTRELLHSIFSIADPRQRWVVSRGTAINPAFAVADVVWIMRGRNDSAFVNAWNSQLPKYAGEGDSYHGAYGFRLRQHFGVDQLERAYSALSNVPDSRQIALHVWDSSIDLPREDGSPVSADVPCNIVSLLKVRDNKLEWMQVMRSNDLYRGTPYNFIQFTTLQEVMAGWLGLELGSYNHLSDSLHIYESDLAKAYPLSAAQADQMMYGTSVLNTDSLMLDKSLSDSTFRVMERLIEQLITKPISDGVIRSSIASAEGELPASYLNLFLLVAAEAARRGRWGELPAEIMSANTSPAITYAWRAWAERTATEK